MQITFIFYIQYGNKAFSSKYKLKTTPPPGLRPKRAMPEPPRMRVPEEAKIPPMVKSKHLHMPCFSYIFFKYSYNGLFLNFQEIPMRTIPGKVGRESIVAKLPGGDLINKIKTQISTTCLLFCRNSVHTYFKYLFLINKYFTS